MFKRKTHTVLAGDVGGTNSRFMLYEVDPNMTSKRGEIAPGKLVFKKQYANEGVSEFIMQLERFFVDAGCSECKPAVACLAIAGPVAHNAVRMTNRGWLIDGNDLAKKLGIGSVRLVNDFVAAGYGLLTLDLETECICLQEGRYEPGSVIACIGSGTGLGETFLTCPPGSCDYDCYPSEGGHAELAPKDELQWELVQFLKHKFEQGLGATAGHTRVSVERVVSGTGLVNVYDFLAEKFPDRVDAAVHAMICSAGDLKAKIISENAHVPGSICEEVLTMWAMHYGSEAGVAGLKFIPHGGLFLAGGMTPKNIQWIQGKDSAFMKSFRDKGRVSPLLEDVPIYAVLKEDIGQRGAHYVAFQMYKKLQGGDASSSKYTLTLPQISALAVAAAAAGVIVSRAL